MIQTLLLMAHFISDTIKSFVSTLLKSDCRSRWIWYRDICKVLWPNRISRELATTRARQFPPDLILTSRKILRSSSNCQIRRYNFASLEYDIYHTVTNTAWGRKGTLRWRWKVRWSNVNKGSPHWNYMQITPPALRAFARDIQLPISFQWGGKNREFGNVTKNRLEAFCWGMVNGIWKGKCKIQISYIHLRKIVS